MNSGARTGTQAKKRKRKNLLPSTRSPICTIRSSAVSSKGSEEEEGGKKKVESGEKTGDYNRIDKGEILRKLNLGENSP